MPLGMRWNLNSRPSLTTVCPALLPPCERTTISTRSASRSMTLPLPSSPHCPPTRMVTLIAAVKRTGTGGTQGPRRIDSGIQGAVIDTAPARVPINAARRGAAGGLAAAALALGVALLVPRAFSDPVGVDPYDVRPAAVSVL